MPIDLLRVGLAWKDKEGHDIFLFGMTFTIGASRM